MMEMVEEKQDLNNEVQARVERILHVLQEDISIPVSEVYKEKLNATLDLKALRGMLEAIAPELPKDGLDDNALMEQLDLSAWLSLILGRWALFEPILKNTGRNAVQILKDVHNRWISDVKFMTIRDARNVALSAYELLNEFGRTEAAKEVGVIKDELVELMQSQDKQNHSTPKSEEDDIPTIPNNNNHWLGTHEVAEKPTLAPAHNPIDTKNGTARIDRNRTKQIKPPADLLFLKLEVVEKSGTASAQTIDLKKPSLIIGRSQMADVELSDPLVSRIHLLVTGTTPYNIKVTDLNSSNGTCLDGMPLKPNESVYWDVGKPIVIGETWMVLRQTS